jgi:carboxypeptidase family protein
MQVRKLCVPVLCVLCLPWGLYSKPETGTISGKITFTGTPAKARPIDTSKEPECAKVHPEKMVTDDVVTGPGNVLQNVVVHVSAGPPETAAAPRSAVNFEQKGCQYATHVLALRTGQDVSIANDDPFSHNIHPLAKINREWNRIQPPGTPPFTYSYENEEIIPVKCNIHSWMKAYFVVLKTGHFAVTGEDGEFKLPELPPGTYTVTAWHEVYGTQTREISVAGGETRALNFVFQAKP